MGKRSLKEFVKVETTRGDPFLDITVHGIRRYSAQANIDEKDS